MLLLIFAEISAYFMTAIYYLVQTIKGCKEKEKEKDNNKGEPGELLNGQTGVQARDSNRE